MAPLPESRKRPAPPSEENEHHLKRQKRQYHHIHSTHIKQSSAIPHILNDPLSISHQLRRSIALVLRTIGFSDSTPAALEMFTSLTEEYMAHLLRYVRTAMEAGKRTQAIPFDFKYALNANQLTLWSLLPHLDPPTSDGMDASKTPVETMVVVAPRIEVQEKIINKDEELMKQFSLRLRGEQTQTRLPYAARKLPTLPSRHTYKSTPAVSERVTGPKTIRERATEESRLSEEALRRLVGARQNRVKNHALSILSSNHAQVSGQGRGNGTGAGDIKSAYQNCWDMLVEQAQDDEDRVDLKRTDFSGPLINAESRYWRKGARVGKKSSVSVGGRGSG